MCSYRRAHLLRNTLESIKRQNYPDLEIIVCEDGDDGGATRRVCEEYGARYAQRKDRPDQPYSNPSIPWNIAIRQATGDILILQNPECMHVGEDAIAKLVEPHWLEERVAVFATTAALHPDGRFHQWYCHPKYSARPFFFCGSLRREDVWNVGGFDEDFGRQVGGYGYDDDFFAFCLSCSGVRFLFTDQVMVHHQWHEGTNCYGLESNQDLFVRKLGEVQSGIRDFRCNTRRGWGVVGEELAVGVEYAHTSNRWRSEGQQGSTEVHVCDVPLGPVGGGSNPRSEAGSTGAGLSLGAPGTHQA